MTWDTRVLPEISLRSPSGIDFSALWSGNHRKVEKRLGIYEHPRRPGAVIQDMDVSAVSYPLDFAFEGPNHDLDAGRFFDACRERGTWTVRHPVRGLMTLQLVSVQEDIQPVTSGNMTSMATEWLEVVRPPEVVYPLEIAAQIVTKTGDIQTKVQNKFSVPDKNKVMGAVNSIKATMQAVKAQVAEVNAAIEAIHRGITETLVSATIDGASLAGMIQTMITLPGMTLKSLSTTFDYYINVALNPGTDEPKLAELISTSALVVVMQNVTDGELTTREESLRMIDQLTATFQTVTDNLPSDAQLTTYNDMASAINDAVSLLLIRTFDLGTAKHITLAVPRSPVEIALTEGVDLDLFIASNSLKGADILLLPAGRNVVVYL